MKLKKKILDTVAPVGGVAGVAVCPICVPLSATILSYLGLAAIVPAFAKIAAGFLFVGVIGFFIDYKKHSDPMPMLLLLLGITIVYMGRYHSVDTIVWIAGGLMIIFSIIHNKSIIKKTTSSCKIDTDKNKKDCCK